MTPIKLLGQHDLFSDSIFSFVRRRGAKKDQTNADKKTKNASKDAGVERSNSRTIRDGHDILEQASALLKQHRKELGSDIGFYQGRVQELMQSAPLKGKLSKKRRPSIDFVNESKELLTEVQKALGMLSLDNGYSHDPAQPPRSRSKSRSRSPSPLPVLMRFTSSPKVSFVEAELPSQSDLKKSSSRRDKTPKEGPDNRSQRDLTRQGTIKHSSSSRPKDYKDTDPNRSTPPKDNDSGRSRKQDRRPDDEREDGRYRYKDDYKRSDPKYSSHRPRSRSYERGDPYKDRDRDRYRTHDRHYSDSRAYDRDRHYDSRPRRSDRPRSPDRKKRSPSPGKDIPKGYSDHKEREPSPGEAKYSKREPSPRGERRSRRADRPDGSPTRRKSPARLVQDNPPLSAVPAGGGVPFVPTIVELPPDPMDKSSRDRDRDRRGIRDRDRDRDRDKDPYRYRDRDRDKDRGNRDRERGKVRDPERPRRDRSYTPDYDRSRRHEDDSRYRSRHKPRDDRDRRHYYEERSYHRRHSPDVRGGHDQDVNGSRFLEVFSPPETESSSLPKPAE